MKTKIFKITHTDGRDNDSKQKNHFFERRAGCATRWFAGTASGEFWRYGKTAQSPNRPLRHKSVKIGWNRRGSDEQYHKGATWTVAAQLQAGGEGNQRARQTRTTGVLFKADGQLHHRAWTVQDGLAYEHIVELVKHLNRTRDNYDARISTIDAKLDIIFERLDFQSVLAKKPTFPTRPKRFKDLPAFLLRDISLYFLKRTCRSFLVWWLTVIMILLSVEIEIYL